MTEKKFPQPSLTVDIVLFRWYRSQVQLLLIKRKANPFKDCWALPGGFVGKDESTAAAAYRELWEETGLKVPHLAPLKIFDTANRDPRGWTISMAYWGLTKYKSGTQAGTDAKEARWFSVDDLPDLSFDHGEIIQYTVEKIHHYSTLARQLLAGLGEISIPQLKTIIDILSNNNAKKGTSDEDENT